MNAFALGEAEAAARHRRGLIRQAADMDRDAAGRRIVFGVMRETFHGEIGVEFAIHPLQQVQGERRGNARRVVIGGVEPRPVLLEIDADQHRTAGTDHGAALRQEPRRFRGREIADARAGEEGDPPAAAAPQRRRQRNRRQEIGADRDHLQTGEIERQIVGGAQQNLARYVDADIGPRLFERAQQQLHFLPGAAAIFDQRHVGSHELRDLARMFFQNADFRARRIIFGRFAYRLEQVGAALVIQKAARNSLLRSRQPVEHRVAEALELRTQIVERDRAAWPHDTSSARRMPPMHQRAAGGKKLR